MASMITFTHSGNLNKTKRFLKKTTKSRLRAALKEYGKLGVLALEQNTPKDSGKTASSWGYEVHCSHDSVSIVWTNSNTNSGANVAILIQYGHATRNGGFVSGIDYINPAIKPIFDMIADNVWKEVEKG